MKIFIFLFSVLSFGFSMEKGFSQDTKIVFDSDVKLSVEQVFDIVKKQTDLTFIYKSDLFANTPKIHVDQGEITLKNLLIKCKSVADFDFQISKKGTIYLKENPKKIPSKPLQLSVNGTISDQDGQPLPGANVVEKGTSNGVTADFDGKFSIDVADNRAILVVSYVGFTTKEVALNGSNNLNIVLEENTASLEEVVVVGYGSKKKKDLTGAVASADIEAFRESPNVNIMQSLQGSVAGVQISQVTQAGEEPSISIRGQTTLDGNTSPLIVVDGIYFKGNLSDINPSDVKSIDILKDPSSKAIYGAQAANGVILITTKEGRKSQKHIITYNTSVTSSVPTVNYRLFNREETLQRVKQLEYKNAYLAPDYTQPNPDWDYGQSSLNKEFLQGIADGNNFDWFDAISSTGFLLNNVLSVSGGSENTTYYLSIGNTNQDGFILNDDYKRNTARINIETDITNWLTIGANTYATFADYSGKVPQMSDVLSSSPFVVPKDENGEYIITPYGDAHVNIFLDAQADDRDLQNRLSGNLYTKIQIPQIEGLSYRLNYSNTLNWTSHSYSNIYDAGLTGLASKTNTSTYDMMLDNILTYQRQFGDHDLNITALVGMNKVQYNQTSAVGENFTNLSLSYNSLEQAATSRISSDAWEESSLYQMGRLDYKYKDRYLLTGTLRRDGFSGFSKGHKYGLFPSMGIGWVLSEESFLKIPQINFLKIRASYGQNGNLTSRYSSLAMVSSSLESQYVYGDGAATSFGQTPISLPNDNLSWEKTTGLNIGLDFAIFDQRISGNIEYYNTTTTDLLWDFVLPQITGFSEIQTNLGKIKNQGFEFTFHVDPIAKKDFNWNFDVNFSANQNKIVELLGIDNDGDGKEDDLVANGLFIGHSIGTIYGYETNGLWQLDDDIPTGYSPGTNRIVDQNGDGTITAGEDRKILGRSEPAYNASILNSLSYKNFNLRFFMNTVQGSEDSNLGLEFIGFSGSKGNDVGRSRFNNQDNWSPLNPGAHYPLQSEAAAITPNLYVPKNFVRLQDITLSYQIDSNVLDRIGLRNTKLFINGKNLITITDWKGWDPETGQNVNTAQPFPVMKSYSVGLDISL